MFIKQATKGALKCADALGVESIAFPGMGTGIGGVQYSDAARVMVSAIYERIKVGTGLKKIVLIDLDSGMVEAFSKVLRQIS